MKNWMLTRVMRRPARLLNPTSGHDYIGGFKGDETMKQDFTEDKNMQIKSRALIPAENSDFKAELPRYLL